VGVDVSTSGVVGNSGVVGTSGMVGTSGVVGGRSNFVLYCSRHVGWRWGWDEITSPFSRMVGREHAIALYFPPVGPSGGLERRHSRGDYPIGFSAAMALAGFIVD
jgi:hypothetical protein